MTENAKQPDSINITVSWENEGKPLSVEDFSRDKLLEAALNYLFEAAHRHEESQWTRAYGELERRGMIMSPETEQRPQEVPAEPTPEPETPAPEPQTTPEAGKIYIVS